MAEFEVRPTRLLKWSGRWPARLDQNAPHQFAARHALAIHPSESVYTLIPKNACTTLRYSVALANGLIAGPDQFAWVHQNIATMSADLPALARARYAFVVLRCPYRRLASAFVDKFGRREPSSWVFFTARGRRDDMLTLTFRQFVEALGEPAVRNADIHWRPQVDFLVYETYDDVFSVEAFGDAVATLERRISLTVADARGLAGHDLSRLAKRPAGERHADTPLHAISAMLARGEAPAPESLYDDALRQRVRDLYSDDFDLYARFADPRALLFAD